MDKRIFLGLLAVMLAIVGTVSAANTVPVNGTIGSTLSISVTNTVPNPWSWSLGTNTLSDVIVIDTTNNVPAVVKASATNGGYLNGTKGSLQNHIMIPDGYDFIFSGTAATLEDEPDEGTRDRSYGLSQVILSSDKAGSYSGTLTFLIEAS